MQPTRQVAFIDDDDDLRRANVQTLELADFAPLAFGSAHEALQRINRDFAGVVVTDIRMPVMDGLELFRLLRALDEDLPVILVTGHGDVAMAVRALQDGAYDFLTKPYASDDLVASVRRALEKRALVLDLRRLRKDAERADEDGPLLGRSPAIVHLRKTLRRLAEADVDVLIEGETGVGKALAASVLHRSSARRGRPFVTIDCAALPEGGEAELFGHESGFSGAVRRRVGRIEGADRGVLFLDDVDALSPALQARLLRLLEERSFTPLSSNELRSLDVRIIATTRVDLAEATRSGAFRQDLFYRLNAARVRIAPLRERRDDVALLYGYFLTEAARRFRRETPEVSDDVRRHLGGHGWPGNVRELAHFAERIVLGVDDQIATAPALLDALSLPQRVDAFEAALICDALSVVEGDVRAALERLGIPRKTFYDKLRRHGIDISRFRQSR
jgi:two-component system C4-dicarboxylate transport response regulator DctD